MMDGERSLFGRERWTATELGEALCLSAQRINQLVKEGVVPSAIDGRNSPFEAVPSYIRFLKQKAAGRSQAGEAVTKMQLENQMRRIKLQRIAGELVPIARVKKDFFECARRVRDGLLNMPSRLSGVFAAESNQEKIFELFNKEVHVVLTELASGHAVTAADARLPLEDSIDRKSCGDDLGDAGMVEGADLSNEEVEPHEGRFSDGD